jgi:hypothetical protein
MCLVTALRILSRDIYCEDGVATLCLLDAADEIERLREAIRRLAAQDATLSVCEGNVTVTMDGTLTDDEREAITDAAGRYVEGLTPNATEYAATLRGLLRRCPAAENDAKQDNP